VDIMCSLADALHMLRRRQAPPQVITEPTPTKSLRAVLAVLKPLRERFPRIPDAPADSVDPDGATSG
jgi:hypothetical protein